MELAKTIGYKEEISKAKAKNEEDEEFEEHEIVDSENVDAVALLENKSPNDSV